ncbi:hypothetical protein M501DRAFT_925821 [Patellaria atrata CBS 101060]|uniref:R3H domain-containing protein n=1 Tax=Patellaria atrata CBS 101060 TaxID=1346257 RepID=A0A9P4SI66_9PEZI|nr:hypothetical protein M501DRAFT_925821 [Patellaria atrata CBS 101060]
MAQGRQFGGQLTSNEPPTANSQLQANSPDFKPGKPVQSRPPPQLKPRRRRASKSSAPDIATRIHEDIDNGHYECAICTNEVYRNSKVWSCRTCWTVFHMTCIKKWSSNEGSAMAQQQAQNGDIPPPRQWRCPGCNLPKDTLLKSFTCWCEKEIDPKSEPGLPPFSCGQTCSRSRVIPKKCPHRCAELCHAGPCPPCSQMGPAQSCFCGKDVSTKRCIDTDYENGWSCGQVCGELMPCGDHYCERPCHEGLCGACEVLVPSRCYCGQTEKDVLCCDKEDEKFSSISHMNQDGKEVLERWTCVFDCGKVCNRAFGCGKHNCEKTCHIQLPDPPHCPRSPNVVSHCPCGKTPLSKVSDAPRTTCEDPIPNCEKVCLKLLSCGHPCQQVCHSGDCMPCFQSVPITCRCGRTTTSTMCHQGTVERPQCFRVCRVSLNCGRHECGERCCAGEKKAAERQSNKRKLRPLNSALRPFDDGFEAEHICTRPCGRLLKCGNHSCQELCHKGPCGSCREAIFDDIGCNCGRTVLQPPLPCGTQPPPCRFQCGRAKDCGHPQVPHNCHQDDEECPKCPFLTQKSCMCGRNTLKNQQCWLNDVRCGEVCGKKLKCGSHKCRQPCHRPSECEDAWAACQQGCGKEKSCGHPCSERCHSPYSCKEDKPCQFKIFITCDCQHIKQEAKCNAVKGTAGNSTKTLKCDDECARLERNRKLALALNIDQVTHTDNHVPYSAETINMFQENVKWAQNQEKTLRIFAADTEEKRLRFKPMPSHQRAFLHSLAEDFGFDSESMDPEPHRHIAIFKTPKFVMAPVKTLAECARIRYLQRVTANPTASAEKTVRKKLKASNLVGDPFNGFLITSPRFGLTIEELRTAIRPALASKPQLKLDISFLPSEEIVLKATAELGDRDVENELRDLKPVVTHLLAAQAVGRVQLCRLDSSLNLERREDDASSGWSQVAAKAAAPARAPVTQAARGNNSFTVLSLSKKKEKLVGKDWESAVRGKERKPSVVDDWEAAEIEEEEKEKAVSGESGGEEGRVGDVIPEEVTEA